MDLKQVILSDASTEAKVSAIAILLDKELPKLTEQVDTVKKLKGEQGEQGLKGDKGDRGEPGKDGKDGRDGIDGSTGKDGIDGEDGISVVDAKVDFDDTLVLTLSNGKEINVGEVKGEKGENGRDGNTGANGIGVPTGGTSGQILAKNSNSDYDTHWINNTGGGGGGISSVASADGTVIVSTVSGAVDLSVPVTTNVVCKVRNATGATLTKGTVVYINGATGQLPTVTKAIATGDSTSAQTLGVMSNDLANNSDGYVTIIGLVTELDTSAYTDGQQLYLSGTTAGGFTATKPYAPTHLVYVAVVEYAHPIHGKLFIKVQNGYEMDELHNVSAHTPNNGDTLVYNSSTSLWESTARNLGTVTSVSATVPTGLSVSGSPITSSGTLAISYASGYAIPTTSSQTNWDTAYTDRYKWDGGATGLVASTGRASLSAAQSGANTDITSIALTTGTISTAPSSSTDIVNKSYADSIASGVNFHAAVQYATTAALPANTYNNGTSGIGATLTANANGTLTIDGYTLVSGDVGKRLLIKNESTQANNGIYTLTQAGTASLPYILTRATDYDSSGSGTNEVDQGDLILVINGTTNANTSWVQQTPLPITIGSTAIVFIQFAAVQTYTAGTGLTLATNQFSITNIGTAGTYGSASQVPVITTNAQGQVTSVTNTNIAISGSAVSGNISGNAANVTGTVAIGNGGTGQTTQQAALTALSGTQTSGQYLRSNGTNTLLSAIQAADVPTLNQNTSGSAGSVTNALTAGTGISFSSGTTYNGSAAITISSPLAKATSVFTSGIAATYTAPTNTQWVKVTVVGPGGNGGNATSARATGGSAGGVAIKWLAMTAGQTLTYTVGTATSVNSTVSSGTLTITTITANSGSNGTTTAYANSSTAGPTGGTATGGDINITGGSGGNSYGSSATVANNFSGKGGDCPGFGSGGGSYGSSATAGQAGVGYGAGGGGSHGVSSTPLGAGGIIIFEAF